MPAVKEAQDTSTAEDKVPSRDSILDMLGNSAGPCHWREIAAALEVTDKLATIGLKRRLRAMASDGQLVRTRGSRYGIAEKLELVAGRVIGHRDGFAFVRPDSGGEDIYLSRREAQSAMHNDRVLVRVAGVDRRDRPFGNLVEIVERAHVEIVGRYFEESGVRFVVPDDSRLSQDVLITKSAQRKVQRGDVVVVEITVHPGSHTQAQGIIKEVLGKRFDPGMEVEIALRTYGIPKAWPAPVIEASKRFPDTVDGALANRIDLRELPFVTIDGEDAKDFDDAVYAKRTAKGFRLLVAIADVSHYVKPGDPIDEEAYRRGTSVYFPNRVVPMLPERLSNDLCSLRPEVDRLVMVSEITFDQSGEIRRSKFFRAVIRSRSRLTYEVVQQALPNQLEKAFDRRIAANLVDLYALYLTLREQREQRGALDIEGDEAEFVFDADGKISTLRSRSRGDAHMLIEECMIAANVAAAKFLINKKAGGVFRVHDLPDEEKIKDLQMFLRELGFSFRQTSEPDSGVLAGVLNAARERQDRHLVQTIVLRAMKLAIYSEQNTGHFGLALPAYTHFTSPIRRYPDLMVHRAINAALDGSEGVGMTPLPEAAETCSRHERRAEDATRDVIAWLKCYFMNDKVGESFEGVIAGVAEFGIFVELENLMVEGLVHVTELPRDYYHFDALRHTLTGENSGREFRIGEPVKVQIAAVHLDERKIDLVLAGRGAAPASPARRDSRKQNKPKGNRKKPARRTRGRS